jgi:uncharacterized protein
LKEAFSADSRQSLLHGLIKNVIKSNYLIMNKMSLEVVLILVVIGLMAGTFGGLVGLGGGVIMIPALVYLLGSSQLAAQGTSLAVMLPPVGILAVMNYYKAGHINLKYALIIAVAFTIGGYFGSKLAVTIPVSTVRKIFAAALVIIAVQLMFKK